MANSQHLEILRRGVEAWNSWRSEKAGRPASLKPVLGEKGPDLSQASLRNCDLSGVDLHAADLTGADLAKARLNHANLKHANLTAVVLKDADLGGADLNGAGLSEANLTGAELTEADLGGAFLIRANLTRADLGKANLEGAYLEGAYFMGANLTGANLTEAICGRTVFADIDLRGVRGLETVRHMGPSAIGIDTIYRSKAKIPSVFLRGAGVPEEFILYMASLVARPVQFNSCFISYSSKDSEFAERLYSRLQSKGVRCWFAPEDLKIGDRFQERIEESIRAYDKLVVVLSTNSVSSQWVEREVQAAFEKEQRPAARAVLFPLRLDDAVMKTDLAWAGNVRRTRHIGDFRNWKDPDAFEKSFERLLRDLKTDGPNSPTG